MKNNILENYINYVCPICFEQLQNCKCFINDYPYNLIRIDVGIQEHIRILNKKGYKTVSCCESHKNGNRNMYVMFDRNINVFELPLPEGFVYDKAKNSICWCDFKLKNLEFEKQKAEHLDNLLQWCKSLNDM